MNSRVIPLLLVFAAIAIYHRRDRAILINCAALFVFFAGTQSMRLPGFPEWAYMPVAVLIIGMIVWAMTINVRDFFKWLEKSRSKRARP